MMNRYFVPYFTAIILLGGIFLSAEEPSHGGAKLQSPKQESTDSQPERYISTEAGYSIQFPKDWEVMKKVMGTDVVALAPSKDPQDLFRENVNIIFANLDTQISREDYYKYNLKSLSQLLVDFDLEENLDVTLNGIEAKKIVFTHTLGVVNAKVMQFLMLDGQKAYVLTFTSDPLDFDKFRDQFEGIATSFKFEKEKEKI